MLAGFYSLPQTGGQLDLGKGNIGGGGFMGCLWKANGVLAREIETTFGTWIREVQRYRDETIHRRGVMLGGDDRRTYLVPKDSSVDPILAEHMEPAEVARHQVVAVDFVGDWEGRAVALTFLVVTSLYPK
jgi:hypothetical protein